MNKYILKKRQNTDWEHNTYVKVIGISKKEKKKNVIISLSVSRSRMLPKLGL